MSIQVLTVHANARCNCAFRRGPTFRYLALDTDFPYPMADGWLESILLDAVNLPVSTDWGVRALEAIATAMIVDGPPDGYRRLSAGVAVTIEDKTATVVKAGPFAVVAVGDEIRRITSDHSLLPRTTESERLALQPEFLAKVGTRFVGDGVAPEVESVSVETVAGLVIYSRHLASERIREWAQWQVKPEDTVGGFLSVFRGIGEL